MKGFCMIYKRFDDKLVIRLKKGDKLVESVREILEKENVKAGFLTGIGATDNLEVGLFDPESKEYKIKKYEEDLEIANLCGNISNKDGKLYTHFHITCGRAKSNVNENSLAGEAIAGHLNDAVISLTAEIFVTIIDGKINRIFDQDLGLNLIEF